MNSGTRSTAGTLVDAGAIAVLVVLASVAFGGTYGGSRWLVAGAGGAVVGAAAAWSAARLRWPWWGTVLAAAAGYLLLGAALAVPSSSIGGVLPSVESLRLLTVGVVDSWRQLLTVAVPVGSSGALMIPAYLSALVATAAGTEHRAAHPAPVLGPGRAGGDAGRSPRSSGRPRRGCRWSPGCGVAVGGLLWASWRSRAGRSGAGLDLRRPVSARVVLAAAIAAGYLLGPQVDVGERYALREDVQPPFDPQEYPSPLVGFRKYFKDQTRRRTCSRSAGCPPARGSGWPRWTTTTASPTTSRTPSTRSAGSAPTSTTRPATSRAASGQPSTSPSTTCAASSCRSAGT